MVTKDYKIRFSFSDEDYAKYKEWCESNGLDGYHGAIGGAHHFEILPTSIGEFVSAVATVPLKDEAGNISYDEHGNMRTKRIELVLREP